MRKWWLALLTSGVLVFGLPSTAVADPARPGNYRSEVTGVEPRTDGVRFQVVGGDAFLVAEVDPGVTLEVPGYDGEPYLRVEPDGTVLVNQASPSFWINEDRFGRTTVPPQADAAAAPRWERMGTSGRVGWHDHRVHWMAPQPPPGIDRSRPGLITEWTVPVRVDSTPVTVQGSLWWIPTRSPLPDVALAALVAGAGWWWRKRSLGTGLLLVAGASAASIVGWSQAIASPLGWAGELLAWAPPSLALLAAVASLSRAGGHRYRLLAVAALVGWAATRLPTLWMPVLPSPLPVTAERALFAFALGTAAAPIAAILASDLNGGHGRPAGR